METKVLTNREEIEVLKSLTDSKFLGNGAARAVFALKDTMKESLGINDDRDLVVKLALGLGGLRQNQLETKTFLEYGKSAPLAEIVAYGRYIEVMEAVEVTDDYRDFASEGGDPYELAADCYEEGTDAFEECYNNLQDAEEVIGCLESYFGCTSDNGQLGRNADGDLVAYDYGFTTELSSGDQVSDISDAIEDDDECARYIDGLINLLVEENDCLEDFENRFLNDENGDGTYTRYVAEVLRDSFEDEWTYGDYDCLMDRIHEDVDEDEIKAYKIYEVTYDYHRNEINRVLLETHNIHCEYPVFKICTLETYSWEHNGSIHYTENEHFNPGDMDTCCRENSHVIAYQLYRSTYIFGIKEPLTTVLVEEKIPADRKQEWEEKRKYYHDRRGD